MRSRAPLLIVIATTGCMNEYHPEYHPVTTTTLIQYVDAPTMTVNDAAPQPQPRPSVESRIEREPKTALIVDAKKAARTPAHCDLPPNQPPGAYLGPNVEMGPGITFGGNVYVQGNLIIDGTRAHPSMRTQ